MPKKAEAQARLTVSQQVDRELAAEALKRRQAGEKPSRAQLGALRRVEKEREEELRWQHYRTIPQKHWREMSGRPTKVLQEQAQRYGIPFSGRTIDLPAVVLALHDFFAEHKTLFARAARGTGGENAGDDADTDWLEEHRRERTLIARIEREATEGRYLLRADVHTVFGAAAAKLRQAGDLLERHFGPDARSVLLDALDAFRREVELLCGGPNSSDGCSDDNQPSDGRRGKMAGGQQPDGTA